METCNDNRFEVIEKAKEHLLNSTNIVDAKDEMECLDSFLFRCWQMGWLDRYDNKYEKVYNHLKEEKELIDQLDYIKHRLYYAEKDAEQFYRDWLYATLKENK